jgi:hypothetical protein
VALPPISAYRKPFYAILGALYIIFTVENSNSETTSQLSQVGSVIVFDIHTTIRSGTSVALPPISAYRKPFYAILGALYIIFTVEIPALSGRISNSIKFEQKSNTFCILLTSYLKSDTGDHVSRQR